MGLVQRLFNLAIGQNVLMELPLVTKWSTSMYTDDVTIFISPKKEDKEVIKIILEAFGKALGLRINMDKSSIHPIKCENIDLDHVLLAFLGTTGTFHCRYLGLQLHTRLLQKVHVHPLIECFGQRFLG
jgi:hypothetical protein